MIINSENRTFEASEGLTQKGFSIDVNNPKAFEILSSGLYKDKVLAIIREISCNAYDAQVAVGRAMDPISVHMPTTLEPWYSVTDNGPGLSHEDVINLYSTYFASTKATSNDFIGAFGLGSKSPFSYVDAFTITSRHNAKKRIYSAFKNDRGMPSITLMHEEDTNECNGFEVQVPVKSEDNYEFDQKAKEFYRFFEPKPNFNVGANFTFVENYETLAGMRIYVMGDKSVYLLQGNVAYPVDEKHFVDLIDKGNWRHKPISFVIPVPIGTFEVTASREGISYTPKTMQAVRDLLITKKKEATKEINDKFATCSSYYAAYKYRNNIIEKYGRNKLFDTADLDFTYNGKKLEWPIIDTSTVDGRFKNFRHVEISDTTGHRRRYSYATSTYGAFTESKVEDTTYYINDVSASKLIQTVKFNKDKFNSWSSIYVLEGTDPEAYIRERFADFLPELKLNFVKLSSFPQIVPIAKPKLKPFIVKALKYIDYVAGLDDKKNLIDFDISKGCKYLLGKFKYDKLRPIENTFCRGTYYSDRNSERVMEIVEANKVTKSFDLDNVYLIPIRFHKKLLRYASVCSDFSEEAEKTINALCVDQDLKDYHDKKQVHNQKHFDDIFQSLIMQKNKIASTSKIARDTITFYENLTTPNDLLKEKKITLVNAFKPHTFKDTNNYIHPSQYVDYKIREDFFNTYPLLKQMHVNHSLNDDMIEYINLCKR